MKGLVTIILVVLAASLVFAQPTGPPADTPSFGDSADPFTVVDDNDTEVPPDSGSTEPVNPFLQNSNVNVEGIAPTTVAPEPVVPEFVVEPEVAATESAVTTTTSNELIGGAAAFQATPTIVQEPIDYRELAEQLDSELDIQVEAPQNSSLFWLVLVLFVVNIIQIGMHVTTMKSKSTSKPKKSKHPKKEALNKELVEYLKTNLQTYTIEEVKQSLLSEGLSESDIDEAYASLQK